MTKSEKIKTARGLKLYLKPEVIKEWIRDTKYRIPNEESLYLSLVSGYFGEVEKITENQVAIWIMPHQSANNRVMRFRWELKNEEESNEGPRYFRRDE